MYGSHPEIGTNLIFLHLVWNIRFPVIFPNGWKINPTTKDVQKRKNINNKKTLSVYKVLSVCMLSTAQNISQYHIVIIRTANNYFFLFKFPQQTPLFYVMSFYEWRYFANTCKLIIVFSPTSVFLFFVKVKSAL